MPEFEKSKGFKMKGPTFFGSALKKYRKAPLKHDGSTPAGDMRHDHMPGDAGQAEEKKPMTSPQVEERETQPGDAGQMKMPESPTKGLKDILGKAKDKLSGGVGAGAGIGMMLGGPLGAAIGGGIGAIRKRRKAKKEAAAAAGGAAPAGVPGAGAGSPEPVPSPMGKRGKKRKASAQRLDVRRLIRKSNKIVCDVIDYYLPLRNLQVKSLPTMELLESTTL